MTAGLHQDFDPTVIPTYLKKNAREVIEIAMALGWVMHISSSNAVTIVSPDEKKRYHFSSSGRTSTPMNRIRRDVVRLADPLKLRTAYEASDLFKKGTNRELAGLAMSVLPAPGEEGTVVDHRPDIAEQAAIERRAKNERIVAARRMDEAAKRTLEAQDSKPEPEVESSESERHIVRQEPMLAKSSRGRGYDSKVAIERHWSDGSVDYKCVDCDYASENRLSIRGHRSGAGHTAVGRDRRERLAEVPLAVTYKPRQSRIDALAEELKRLMEAGETDPETIAREALTWVHEQTSEGTGLAAEREPMTAEETLDRIRMLLDRGEQDEIRKRDAEIADLLEQSQALTERVEELESFIELAQTLRRKDSEE